MHIAWERFSPGWLLALEEPRYRARPGWRVPPRRPCDLGPGYVEGAPDLAVEVLSPEDPHGYVREKVAEWLEAGARTVWVVDPDHRAVTVHEPRPKPKHLAEAETLGGGSVLPDFEMPVAAIFA